MELVTATTAADSAAERLVDGSSRAPVLVRSSSSPPWSRYST
jgi:hypothetical protein